LCKQGERVLVETKDDFERETQNAHERTGNWDAVIVTHSSFEKIPVSRATQEGFLDIRDHSFDCRNLLHYVWASAFQQINAL